MAENANQHYVPQFYFKLFNGGARQICVLLTKDGRIALSAPIKGQCARSKFYGTVKIEKELSELESLHAAALRALVETATTDDLTKWSHDHFPWLLQAIAVQRSRTMLEVEKVTPAMQGMFLHMFKEYVKRTRPSEEADEIVGAIERGEVEITRNPSVTVCQQISAAIQSAALLADLQPRVLRNQTDYPFMFSDSPVVFYNSYYRNITNRGVLGFQTPGLQIFVPLTPTLRLMMFDPTVYTGSCLARPFCEVIARADVSQLNALQLHHSRQAVYFASHAHAEYVEELYKAHKPHLIKPESSFRVRKDLLVERDPGGGEIMHAFEPRLNHSLSLSFIHCAPVSPRDYVFRHRSREVVEACLQCRADNGDDEAENHLV
jgi:hypothetical protein